MSEQRIEATRDTMDDACRIVRLEGCPRCGGDHAPMLFRRLTMPVVDGDGTTWTHWSACPRNGEPILVILPERP